MAAARSSTGICPAKAMVLPTRKSPRCSGQSAACSSPGSSSARCSAGSCTRPGAAGTCRRRRRQRCGSAWLLLALQHRHTYMPPSCGSAGQAAECTVEGESLALTLDIEAQSLLPCFHAIERPIHASEVACTHPDAGPQVQSLLSVRAAFPHASSALACSSVQSSIQSGSHCIAAVLSAPPHKVAPAPNSLARLPREARRPRNWPLRGRRDPAQPLSAPCSTAPVAARRQQAAHHRRRWRQPTASLTHCSWMRRSSCSLHWRSAPRTTRRRVVQATRRTMRAWHGSCRQAAAL